MPVRCRRSQRSGRRSWIGCTPEIQSICSSRCTIRRPPSTSKVRPGALAQAFFKALKEQTTFDPTRPLSVVVPNTQPGRANVVQALGAEKIPAFLMEQRIAYNGRLGHLAGDSRPHQLRPRTRAGHLYGGSPGPDQTITVISIGYSTINGQWATSKAITGVSSRPSATGSWGLRPPRLIFYVADRQRVRFPSVPARSTWCSKSACISSTSASGITSISDAAQRPRNTRSDGRYVILVVSRVPFH